MVTLPESVIFCTTVSMSTVNKKDSPHFEGVHPVPIFVERVHKMHGGRRGGSGGDEVTVVRKREKRGARSLTRTEATAMQ